MSDSGVRRAEDLLQAFIGSAVIASESGKYQLRLMFENSLEFVVSSPWRVILRGNLLGGSGDEGGEHAKQALDSVKGLKVVSASVLSAWDTRLVLQGDCVLEVIPDSVQYETWEAHVEVGWAIFGSGEFTLFPPAQRADAREVTKVDVYGAEGSPLTQEIIKAAAEIMQGIEGLRSVGIAPPSQTGCTRTSHRRSSAFDVVELNGTPLSSLTEHGEEDTLLKRVQLAASNRGAKESYGPAGLFQNGSQVLVPELQARFTRHLHISLGSGNGEFA
jgi:hypothetical protein